MIDKTQLRELVAKGFSDQEIGKLMGVSRQRIHQLRHALGLPLGRNVRDARVREMLEVGMLQTEAAAWTGLSYCAVHDSAKRQGLGVGLKVVHERKMGRHSQIVGCAIEGLTVSDMAQRLQMRVSTIGKAMWEMRRNKHGVVARRPGVSRQRWLARNAAILKGAAQGKSDEQMAHELGTTVRNVSQLRDMLTSAKTAGQ